MRIIGYLLCVFVLSNCTSVKKLSDSFSAEPIRWPSKGMVGFFQNESAVENDSTYLWDYLVNFREKKTDTLASVPSSAIIGLGIQNGGKTMLEVCAYNNGDTIESFLIPVKKRRKSILVVNRVRVIPIPILYFEITERKVILNLLENNRIGISGYRSEMLWILFFGASDDARSHHEYPAIDFLP